MTWLDEAKRHMTDLKEWRGNVSLSNHDEYIRMYRTIAFEDHPRALELLTEAEGFIEDCICGTDQDDDERVAFLRKLRGEEVAHA